MTWQGWSSDQPSSEFFSNIYTEYRFLRYIVTVEKR